jgi:hypothetical protein
MHAILAFLVACIVRGEVEQSIVCEGLIVAACFNADDAVALTGRRTVCNECEQHHVRMPAQSCRCRLACSWGL